MVEPKTVGQTSSWLEINGLHRKFIDITVYAESPEGDSAFFTWNLKKTLRKLDPGKQDFLDLFFFLKPG